MGRASPARRTVRLVVASSVIAFGVLVVAAPPGHAAPAPGAARVVPAPARQEPGDLPAPTASPDEVRQAADDVLARPEFQRPEPNLVEKAQSWFGEYVGRVLQNLTSGSGASIIGWGVLLTAIAAIVFLLLRFSRTVQADPHRATAISVERSRTATEWDAEAERLERDQQWKLALRCRFRALVAVLVEHGLVDDVPGRTAGEYREEVAVALPEVSTAFADATMLFEDAWYGDRPTGEDESRCFRELAAEVGRAARNHRRSGPTDVAVAEPVPA